MEQNREMECKWRFFSPLLSQTTSLLARPFIKHTAKRIVFLWQTQHYCRIFPPRYECSPLSSVCLFCWLLFGLCPAGDGGFHVLRPSLNSPEPEERQGFGLFWAPIAKVSVFLICYYLFSIIVMDSTPAHFLVLLWPEATNVAYRPDKQWLHILASVGS